MRVIASVVEDLLDCMELVGCLVGWLVDWFVGWLVGWLFSLVDRIMASREVGP